MNDDERCRLSYRDLCRGIFPLRLVFWGGVLNVVDFEVDSDVGRFDLFSDLAGNALILAGTWLLAQLRVDRTYRRGLLFGVVTAALGLAEEMLDFAPASLRRSTQGFKELVGLMEVIAVGVFALMMIRLARKAEIPDAVADWTRTFKWFLWCYVAPVALLSAAGILWQLAGAPTIAPPSFPMAFWVALILGFLGMLLLPWIRLFQSTSRFREALRIKAWGRGLRAGLRPSPRPRPSSS